jgi:hypothetical protein
MSTKPPSNESKARALARAETAKAYLEKKYSKMKQVCGAIFLCPCVSLSLSLPHSHSFQERNESNDRRQSLEEKMEQMALCDEEKERYRDYFLKAEADDMRDQRRRLTTDDFEPLALIGKGAFGEVRLVRMRERFTREIYAMKSMLKEAMIVKNQVGHVRAERDILTESENPWIVTLYYSFQVSDYSLTLNLIRMNEISIW